MKVVIMHEDTARVKHYAEFEAGCTAPIRQWTTRPEDEAFDVKLAEEGIVEYFRALQREDAP